MSDQSTGHNETRATPAVSATNEAFDGLLKAGAMEAPTQPGLVAALERFDVVEIIGQGGMGLVLLARDPATETRVAIKMLRSDLIREPQMVRRFLTEARHMYRLDHPHILRVLEVCDRAAGPFYVMPYKPRGSLAGFIQPGQPLEAMLTLSIGTQVAEALAYAHAQGLIHRDVKPHNILLDPDGRAHLADFGLVRTVFNDSLINPGREGRLGTLAYMSPAVARGEAEDTRCDIYSFGAVLYEMLTGEPPYAGQTREAVLNAILAGPPLPVRQHNPKASVELTAVCEGCMARELRERYASMEDVLADLRRITASEAPLGPHETRSSSRPRNRGRRRVLIGGTAAVLLIVVGWGLFAAGGYMWGERIALTVPMITVAEPPPLATITSAPQGNPSGTVIEKSIDCALRLAPEQAAGLLTEMANQFLEGHDMVCLADAAFSRLQSEQAANVLVTLAENQSLSSEVRMYIVARLSELDSSDSERVKAAITKADSARISLFGPRPPPPSTARLYVNGHKPSAGSGASWADAMNYLQSALTAAAESGGVVREIWVAAGTYCPAYSDGDRRATFRLMNGVTIYGGFTGLEEDLAQRDVVRNRSILSGDFKGDDARVAARALETDNTRSDNVFTVVTASGTDETAVLDGFVITGGYANQNGELGRFAEGGGLRIATGSPLISNCVITGNWAQAGGGVWTAHGGSPRLVNCLISGNAAEVGGGLMVGDDARPLLVNCALAGNIGIHHPASGPTGHGGALAVGDSSPTLINCTLYGNRSVKGSALSVAGNPSAIQSASSVALRNCIVWGNTDPPYEFEGAGIDLTVGLSDLQDEEAMRGLLSATPRSALVWFAGNLSVDPQFKEPGGPDRIAGTADDDLHLRQESPAVDAGDNEAVPPEVDRDLEGHPRMLGRAVDMGAFESPFESNPSAAGSTSAPAAAPQDRAGRQQPG